MPTVKLNKKMHTASVKMAKHTTQRTLLLAVLMSMNVELQALVKRTACAQICLVASSANASRVTLVTLRLDVSILMNVSL